MGVKIRPILRRFFFYFLLFSGVCKEKADEFDLASFVRFLIFFSLLSFLYPTFKHTNVLIGVRRMKDDFNFIAYLPIEFCPK